MSGPSPIGALQLQLYRQYGSSITRAHGNFATTPAVVDVLVPAELTQPSLAPASEGDVGQVLMPYDGIALSHSDDGGLVGLARRLLRSAAESLVVSGSDEGPTSPAGIRHFLHGLIIIAGRAVTHACPAPKHVSIGSPAHSFDSFLQCLTRLPEALLFYSYWTGVKQICVSQSVQPHVMSP
jgi:hypothetical protein